MMHTTRMFAAALMGAATVVSAYEKPFPTITPGNPIPAFGQPLNVGSLTVLYDGSKGWMDGLPDSYFVDVPPFMQGDSYTIPPHQILTQGATLQWDCPSQHPQCEFVALIYECAPCGQYDGGLPAGLLLLGFQRSRCGPSFKTGVMNGKSHRMTAYHMFVLGGNSVSYTTQQDVEYLAIGTDYDAANCGSFNQMVPCESTNGQCTWDLQTGKCVRSRCVSPGPGNGCQYCVRDEVWSPLA